MLATPLCPLLGIDLPIIQAPIGSATAPALAAAVSNAGGLGMLAVTWQDIDALRHTLRATRRLTDRPFGVNLVLHWPPVERLAVCLAEGVAMVSFFWGDPAPYVARVHDAGALVAHTVASAVEARQAVAAGVDVVVAQGWEAGGHVWGSVAALPLIPRVVDAVAPAPVVAAGGIADGSGLAAALALGAAGAWMGTRFLLSEEAAAHAVYKGTSAGPRKPTRPMPPCSTATGRTRRIARCATARSGAGKRRAARRPAGAPAKGRRSPSTREGASWSGTATHFRWWG